ncbi:hypothetical protein 278BB001_207 [Bacillus phage 278BB001]|nr:hypothetical protein 278BB001_207 [Bacillus phage 278BB001]
MFSEHLLLDFFKYGSLIIGDKVEVLVPSADYALPTVDVVRSTPDTMDKAKG